MNYFALLLFVCFVDLSMLWLVYDDVTRYMPLPRLCFAEFLGVAILIIMLQTNFCLKFTEVNFYENLPRDKRRHYMLSKMLVSLILLFAYSIIKLVKRQSWL